MALHLGRSPVGARPAHTRDPREAPAAVTHTGTKEVRGVAVLATVHQLEVHVGAAADPGAADLGEDPPAPDPLSGDDEVGGVVCVHRHPTAGVNDEDHVAVSADAVAGVADDPWRCCAYVPSDVAGDVHREVIATFPRAVSAHEASVGNGPAQRPRQAPAPSAGRTHPAGFGAAHQEIARRGARAQAEAARDRPRPALSRRLPTADAAGAHVLVDAGDEDLLPLSDGGDPFGVHPVRRHDLGDADLKRVGQVPHRLSPTDLVVDAVAFFAGGRRPDLIGADPGDDDRPPWTKRANVVVGEFVPRHDLFDRLFVGAREIPDGLSLAEEVIRAVFELRQALPHGFFGGATVFGGHHVDALARTDDDELAPLRESANVTRPEIVVLHDVGDGDVVRAGDVPERLPFADLVGDGRRLLRLGLRRRGWLLGLGWRCGIRLRILAAGGPGEHRGGDRHEDGGCRMAVHVRGQMAEGGSVVGIGPTSTTPAFFNDRAGVLSCRPEG